tara:strand:+ start:4142 stop:4258 length:117 start_codon:yes stop_codon:yes gene_type:complete
MAKLYKEGKKYLKNYLKKGANFNALSLWKEKNEKEKEK